MFILSSGVTFVMAGRSTFKEFGLSNLLPIVTYSVPLRRRIVLPSNKDVVNFILWNFYLYPNTALDPFSPLFYSMLFSGETIQIETRSETLEKTKALSSLFSVFSAIFCRTALLIFNTLSKLF